MLQTSGTTCGGYPAHALEEVEYADYPAVGTNVVLTGGSVLINTQDGTNTPTWTYGTNSTLVGMGGPGAKPTKPVRSGHTCAGDGSGGGIILSANHLYVYGTVQAKGGDGKGDGNTGGGDWRRALQEWIEPPPR